MTSQPTFGPLALGSSGDNSKHLFSIPAMNFSIMRKPTTTTAGGTAPQQHGPTQAGGHPAGLLLQDPRRVQQDVVPPAAVPGQGGRGLLGRQPRPGRRPLGEDARVARRDMHAAGHAEHQGERREGARGGDSGISRPCTKQTGATAPTCLDTVTVFEGYYVWFRGLRT